MSELHAQPYAGGGGFYFESAEEFHKQYAKYAKRGIEEFEIQFINGDSGDSKLFDVFKISQSEIDTWFEQVEDLSQDEKAALFYLGSYRGESLAEALATVAEGDVQPQAGTMEDYARDYIDSIGGVKELGDQAQTYFDYEAFGRDVRINGEDTNHLIDEQDYAKRNGDDEEVERLQEQIDRIDALSERELGEELADDLGWEGVGEKNMEMYFDYEAFANDLEMGGDRYEFDFDGNTYTVDNH